jgi:hypothetical protein
MHQKAISTPSANDANIAPININELMATFSFGSTSNSLRR